MRWTTFIQAMQIDIADNEELMDQMTKVNLVKQEVSDTINSIKLKCQALTDFVDARQLIMNQDSTYKKLYKAALKYSLAAKLATKLEKVKATEQNLSGKIQTRELLPMLNKHMGAIDDKYANLQVISKKIQEMEYKPFIQRIKDYLIEMACVAILLLLMHLAVAKLQAARKVRKSMAQYQNMLNKNGVGDYPTI